MLSVILFERHESCSVLATEEEAMVSENLMDTHVPGIVGAIFKRLGRAWPERAAAPDGFVFDGRVKHVETARRTFALCKDGRHYCVSWDDGTAFIGTDADEMQGTDVVVRARVNIIGLHAESIASGAASACRVDAHSPPPIDQRN